MYMAGPVQTSVIYRRCRKLHKLQFFEQVMAIQPPQIAKQKQGETWTAATKSGVHQNLSAACGCEFWSDFFLYESGGIRIRNPYMARGLQ